MFTGGVQQKPFGTHLFSSVRFGITLHGEGDNVEFISYRIASQPTHKHITGEMPLTASSLGGTAPSAAPNPFAKAPSPATSGSNPFAQAAPRQANTNPFAR